MKTQCSHCNATFSVQEAFFGRNGKCPKCGKVFTVKPMDTGETDAYSMAEATKPCPVCGETILETAKKCKHCGELLAGTPVSTGSSFHHPPQAGQQRANSASKTSRMAIASFVLSLLGVSLLGLIFGILGLTFIKRSSGALKGRGFALAGTVISGLVLVLQILAVPTFIRAQALTRQNTCASHLRSIGLALNTWAIDHQDTFPPTLDLLTNTDLLQRTSLVCPGPNGSYKPLPYVYRGNDLTTMCNPGLILAFEQRGNHPSGVYNVLYVDASCRAHKEDVKDLIAQDNELRRRNHLPQKDIDGRPILVQDNEGANARLSTCASNLKQIHAGLCLYSQGHEDQFPPTLDVLVSTSIIKPDCLICPGPNGSHAPLPYVYRGSDLNPDCDPRLIVVYEPLGNHSSSQNRGHISDTPAKYNIVWGDGHVTSESRSVSELIRQDNKVRQENHLPSKNMDG